jgi:hypothetical protein
MDREGGEEEYEWMVREGWGDLDGEGRKKGHIERGVEGTEEQKKKKKKKKKKPATHSNSSSPDPSKTPHSQTTQGPTPFQAAFSQASSAFPPLSAFGALRSSVCGLLAIGRGRALI